MIGNLLAGLALGVATLSGLALMAIGLSNDSGRDGGRLLGGMMAALPFGVALLLAGAVAVAPARLGCAGPDAGPRLHLPGQQRSARPRRPGRGCAGSDGRLCRRWAR